MNKDLNRWVGIGRLTRDPELRHIPSGAAVTDFSIASNNFYTQNGEKKEEVSFFNVTAWGKHAETIVKYMKKGSPICIEGRLKQSTWDDTKTGEKRSSVGITVESFHFLQGKSEQTTQEQTGQESGSQENLNFNKPFSDEDIPF